jgi:hypothetical protein
MTKTFNNNKMTKASGNRPGRRNAIKKMVSDMIESRAEMKRVVGTSSAAGATAGAIIYKSAVAQGDGYTDRTGDKIRIHSIEWTAAYVDTNNNLFRCMLVEDTSNVGAAPAVTDILSSASVFAHMNPIYEIQHRFRVLLDVVLATSATGEQYAIKRGTIKTTFPNYFNGTANDSASGGKNGLYALVIANAATGTYNFSTSIRFTDI